MNGGAGGIGAPGRGGGAGCDPGLLSGFGIVSRSLTNGAYGSGTSGGAAFAVPAGCGAAAQGGNGGTSAAGSPGQRGCVIITLA
ncbi:hypothetical protein [Streptomyces uncialis]|uniref:hypothetical protein n=1 Tax=Streptomyces uncialis TaxID=1048205 RepID=UPI0038635CA4|nr:hypothetical protein OG268_01360 [Streptomyces uncialis]